MPEYQKLLDGKIIFAFNKNDFDLEKLIEKNTCFWKNEIDFWTTSCDNSFVFLEGNIKENEFVFCPYCGKRIKEIEK